MSSKRAEMLRKMIVRAESCLRSGQPSAAANSAIDQPLRAESSEDLKELDVLALEARLLYSAVPMVESSEAPADGAAPDVDLNAWTDGDFDSDPDASGGTDSGSNETGSDASDANDRASLDDADGQLWDGADGFSLATSHELIFIDSGVENIDQLLENIASLSDDTRNIEIIFLDPTRDGVQQITDELAGRTDIDALHIVTHGDDGSVQLGNTRLSSDTLSAHAGQIASWGGSLDIDADILFYGCDLASNESGEQLVESIAILTDADVAASDDLTGHADLGGDWILEYTVGDVSTDVAFGYAAQASWHDTLATIFVTTTEDENDGNTSDIASLTGSPGGTGISLREAIIAANNTIGADTIFLGAGTYGLDIAGKSENASATGDLDITGQITIIGDSLGTTILDASSLGDRMFHVANAGNLSLGDITLTGASSGNTGGAAVYNEGDFSATDVVFSNNSVGNNGGGAIYSSGTTTLNHTTLIGNTSGASGGAIYVYAGTTTIINSTISGNQAESNGGGIFVEHTYSTLNIVHSTIADNSTVSASGYGGGVYIYQATVNAENSIFADNTSDLGGSDVQGTIVSGGYNIIEDNTGVTGTVGTDILGSDPSLAALSVDAASGHSVHAIGETSIAYNAAGGTSPTVDQRGATRDASADIGAYEYVASTEPLAHYKFDSGTDATDSSANGLDGTLQGHAVIDTTSGTNQVGDGKLTLDGSGDYVDLSANAGTFAALSQGTVATWVKLSTTGLATIFDISSGDPSEFATLWVENGNVFWAISTGGSPQLRMTSTATINDDQWHHVAVTTDASGNTLYIDGVAQTGGDISYSNGDASSNVFFDDLTGVTSVKLGAYDIGSVGGEFTGLIDDVRVYNYAVNDSDMTELHANGSNAPNDLSATATNDGGLNLNNDGGNDAYLIADDGGAVFGGLTELTIETRFAYTDTASELNLVSYAAGSSNYGNDVNLAFNGDGSLSFIVNDELGLANTFDYRTLADGQFHTLSMTWNSSGGAWQVFVDGVQRDSGTNVATDVTIQSGGTLVFGQDQDTQGGGYDPDQNFSGTLQSFRVFDDLRTASEISSSYASDLPFDEQGMVANWRFDNLSADGVVTESVSGNNLTAAHLTGTGYISSEASLTFALDENAVDGTVVGQVAGADAEREAQIASLLAADPTLSYNAESGKFYQVQTSTTNWTTAESNAIANTLSGVAGQLTVVRSATENIAIRDAADAAGAGIIWMGGSDATVEGEWRWQTAGDDADQFWRGTGAGYAIDGNYQNWDTGEPNAAVSDEDYLAQDSTGAWLDGNTGNSFASIVEWDADAVLDANQALTYTIQSQTVDGAFVTDADTGQITVADGSLLDYESAASHSLTVRVTDKELKTYDKVFTVSLNDLVESNNAPTDLSSGIELNTDGGNDGYLFLTDGRPVLGGLTQLTLEATFQIDSVPSGYIPIIDYQEGGIETEFGVAINPDGSLHIAINNGAPNLTAGTYTELLDGQQHHIAVSWDNTNGDVHFYIDGQFAESLTGVETSHQLHNASTTQLLLGQDADDGGDVYSANVFSGTLHDVRVWNDVRSASEIELNYQAKFDSGNLPSNLVANWQMDGFNGSSEVVDVVSGNNLSVGHAPGAGFIASTPVEDLHIIENAADGTTVGYVVPTDPDVINDVVNDGQFLEAGIPATFQVYESPASIGPWQVVQNSVDLLGDSYERTPLGGLGVDLNGVGPGAIEQTLTTEIGREYQVTFAFSGNWGSDDNTKDLRVSAGGISTDFSVTEPDGWSETNMLWGHRTFTFVAESTSTTLQMMSMDAVSTDFATNNSGPVIGDVQVIEIPAAISTILNNDSTLTYDAATDKFYRTSAGTSTWATANSNAQGSLLNGIAGNLVSIGSQYENDLVQQMAVEEGDDVWVGATDQTTEGEFYWQSSTGDEELLWTGGSTGSALAYENWVPDSPRNSGDAEDFAYLESTDGSWSNIGEGKSRYSVIEWDASEVLSNFTFTLTDDAGGRFEIDATTGEITVTDGSLLDYETATSHNVDVEVTDAAGNSYSEVMTIAVDNVNAAPVINSPGGTLPYTENSGPYLIGAAAAIADADGTDFDGGQLHLQLTSNGLAEDVLDIRNQGTAAGQVGISGTDVTYGGVVVGTYTGPVSAGTELVVTFNSNATLAVVNAVQDNLTYENTSESPSTSIRTIEEYVTDGDGGTSNTISGGIQPVQVNDAPVMTPWSPTYNTTENSNAFTANVSAMLNSSVSDVDAGAVEGIAVYGQTGSSGTLQYSVNGGSSWQTFDSLSETNATLLRATDLFRFTPDGISGGTMTLDYYAWDQTTGTAGSGADVTSRGGSTAYSTTDDTVTINVTDINDEQVVSTNTGDTFLEGSSFNVITSTMLETTDVDNNPAELLYTVTGNPRYGQLMMDGMVAASFTQADINAGRVYYEHYGSEDFSESFSFSVDDGAGSATTGSFSITITPVNDQAVAITSDGAGTTASLSVNETESFVTQVTVSDGDLPGDTMTYSIVGGTDQNDFVIDASGNLTFVSPPDYENADDSDLDNVYEVTVQVSDGDYTDDQTITVTVLDVQSTVLNVTTTSDVDDTGLGASYTIEQLYAVGGGTDGEISLREAITAANNTLGQDTINFAILDTDSGYTGTAGTDAYWQISLTAALPTITESVILDGTSQTVFGANVNPGTLGQMTETGTNGQAISDVQRPEIAIVGAAGFSGIVVGADTVTVQGFSMYGFTSDAAIRIEDAVLDTVINSNVFGVAPTGILDPGAALNNFNHVESVGADNGTLSNNIFAYSKATGFHASNASDNWTVSGNQFINSGYNYSNGDAIAMNASTGGTIDGNYFTGTSTQAIILSGSSSGITISDNTVIGNAVGPITGSHVQYDAIALRSGTHNISLIHNIIADNYGAGILVNDGAYAIEITENSIYGNGTILSRQGAAASGIVGIDLQGSGEDVNVGTAPYYSVNDAGDADTGGNALQNFPVISSAVSDGSQIAIDGTFNSTANTTFTLEFFDSAEYANGYGQGRTFLGSIEVTTDSSGNATFSTTLTAFVSANDFVTATATNQNTDETSEFSAHFAIDGPVYAADNNGHFVFDGNDVITIENAGSLTMSTTMTMEAWINPDDSILTRMILNKEGEYEIGIGDNGNLWWAFTNTDPGWAWHDTGVTVSTTQWSHVAVSYDNGTVNSYINGELVETYAGSGTIGDAHDTMNDLLIGGRLNSPDDQYFLGGMDDVRVWNVARTQAEIQANLTANLSGDETGLVGYYKFDSADPSVTDYSTAGNHGELGSDDQTPTWNGITLTEDAIYTVPASGGVLANDIDMDGGSISVTEIDGNFSSIGSTHTLASGATVTLQADGSFSYDPGRAFENLAEGESAIDSFSYTVTDVNGNSDTATVELIITGTNDAPHILGQNELTNAYFNSDLAGWTATGDVDWADNEVRFGQIGGDPGVLSQTFATEIGKEYFLVFHYGDRSGSESQSLQVDVDGNATLLTEAIQSGVAGTDLESYTFSFVADSTSTTLRFTDTSADHSGVRGYIDNVAVRSDRADLAAVEYTENGPSLYIDNSLVLADVDDHLLDSAVVAITGNYAIGEEVLTFSSYGNITGSWDQSTGTLTLSGSDSVANYQSALRSVRYANISDDPSTDTRTVSFIVNDGDSDSTTYTREINITAVNDLPIADLNGSNDAGIDYTTSFAEGDGQVSIVDADATISDVDNATYEMLGVNLNNFSDGSAELIRINGVTFQYGVADNVTTAVGSTTFEIDFDGSGFTIVEVTTAPIPQSDLQALLRTITYENNSQNPTAGNRTIDVIPSDSDFGNASPVAVSTISVTSANDAPVLATTDGTTSYTEDATSAEIIDGGLTVSDADSVDFASGTINVRNASGGESTDRLTVRHEGTGSGQLTVSGSNLIIDGITIGSFSGGTGLGDDLVITFNANADAADVQSVGRRVAFSSVSQAPSEAARTIEFTITDGDGGTSTVETQLVTVSAVNDAPVLSNTSTILFTDSFETVDISGSNTADPAGWISSNHGSYVEHVDEDSGEFTTPYGDQAIRVYQGSAIGATTDATGLNAPLEPDTLYSLSFNVARGGAVVGEYIVQLLAIAGDNSETILSSVSGTATETDFSESGSITFTSDGSHTAMLGDRIAIRLLHDPASHYTHDVYFDNIQLVKNLTTFVEDGPAVQLGERITVADAELDAAGGGSGNYSGAILTLGREITLSNEDVFSFADGNGISLSGSDLIKNGQIIATFDTTGTEGELTLTFTDANVEIPTTADVNNIVKQITYANNSDAPPESVKIDWTLSDGNVDAQGDGGVQLASGSTQVAITQVNDAPELDDSGDLRMPTISEDDVDNAGQTVAQILASDGGSPISDIDNGSAEGIAITTRNDGRGMWQYSTDGGTNWSSVGTVSETEALLLRSTDLVRFAPDGQNGNTTDRTFEFRAWDQTSGTAGMKVDTSVHGGSSAFSTDIEIVSITTTDVNDAPEVTAPDTATVAENGTILFNQGGSGLIDTSDVDGDELTVTLTANHATIVLTQDSGLLLIDGDGSDGTLQFSGSVADINAAIDGLSYHSQIGYSGDASLAVLVDDGSLTDSTTVAITVTPGQTTFVWDGGGVTNAWTDADNWDHDLVPGADDIVVFNATSIKDSTFDAAFAGSISEIHVDAGYTGTITQARALQSTGDVFIADGSFDTAGFDIEFDSAMNLSGGTLTIDGSTVRSSGDFEQTGGSFSTSGSTLIVDGSSDRLISISDALNSIELSSTGTLTAQSDLAVAGDFTHTQGAVDFAGYEVSLIGSGAQTIDAAALNFIDFAISNGSTITIVGGLDIDGKLAVTNVGTINGADIHLAGNVLTADDTWSGTSQLVLDGNGNQEISTGGGTGELGNLVINKASGTVQLIDDLELGGSFTHTSGDFDTNGHTVEFQGHNTTIDAGSATFGDVILNSTVSGTRGIVGDLNVDGDLTFQNAGTLNGGQILVAGDMVFNDATYTGTTVIVADGTGDQTISAGVAGSKVEQLTINKASGTFTFATDLTIGASLVHTAGTVTNVTNTITFGDNSGTISASAINFADVIIDSSNNKNIAGVLNVGGDLTINRVANINVGDIRVAGDVISNDASVGGDATITLIGTGDQTISGDDLTNGNLIINKSSGTVILADDLVLDGTNQDVNVIAGTLDLNGQTINATGGVIFDDATLRGTGKITNDLSVLNDGVVELTASSTSTYETIVVGGNLKIGTGSELHLDVAGMTAGGLLDDLFTSASLSGTWASVRLVNDNVGFTVYDQYNSPGGSVDVFLNSNPTGTIADVIVAEDAPDTVIDLDGAFSDLEHSDSELTYSLIGYTNPAILDSASIDNAAGSLTLDYAANEHGTQQITVRATDARGEFTDVTFDVTVNPVNDTPIANDDSQAAIEDGAAVGGTLTVSDSDAVDSHTFTLVTAPSEGSAVVNPDGTYTFHPGTDFQDLADGETRDVTFVYRATDDGTGNLADDATVTITVTGTNDAPVAQSATDSASEDGSIISGTLSLTDVDTNDTHTYSLVTSPSEGTAVVNGDGSYTFDPNADFQDLADGETRDVTFVYEVEDNNGLTSQETVTITVTGTNDAPVAQSATDSAVEDGSIISGTLSQTDVDTNDTHTYSLVTGTSEGTAVVNGDGSYTFDPNTDFQDLADGETRNVTFVYEVEDNNGLTSQETVTITVTGTNDAPVAQLATDSASEDGSIISGTLSQTDVDTNDTHTYSLVTGPSEGTAVVNGDGSYTFDPNADFQDLADGETRDVTFVYEVEDNNGLTSQETVTITVTGTNDAPVAQSASDAAIEDGSIISGTLSQTDVDTNDTHTYSLVTGPSEGTAVVNGDGSYTFDPNADFQDLAVGETRDVTFVYEVQDNHGLTSQETVTITVTGSNDAPVIHELDNDTLAYGEGDGAVAIDQGTAAMVTDTDQTNFDGGVLNVSLIGGDFTEDILSVINQGTAAGQIGITGGIVTYQGTVIGTSTGGSNGVDLSVTFNANANSDAVSALVRAISFENSDVGDPTPGTRTARFELTDGDGGSSAARDTFINVVAHGDVTINQGTLPSDLQVVEDVWTPIDLSDVELFDPDHPAGDGAPSMTLSTSDGGQLFAGTVAGVTISGNSSSSVTLTGTANDLNAYLDDPANLRYVHSTANTWGSNADTITLTVDDNQGSPVQTFGTVDISIQAVNDTPINSSSVTVSTLAGNSIQRDAANGVLVGASDVDGDSLTAVMVTGPSSGSVVLNPDGSWTYNPAAGFIGSVSFDFSVNDGMVGSATSRITVEVIAAAPTNPNTGTDNGSGTDSGTGSGSGTDTGTDPDAGSGTGSGTGSGSEAETSTESETTGEGGTTGTSSDAATTTKNKASADKSQIESAESDLDPFGELDLGALTGQQADVQRAKINAAQHWEVIQDAGTSTVVDRNAFEVEELTQLKFAAQQRAIDLAMEQFEQATEQQESLFSVTAGATTSVFIGATAGLALWCMSGTYLASLLFSSMPVWGRFDPIYVVHQTTTIGDGDDASVADIIANHGAGGGKEPAR
ncbi:Pentaxin family protein [Rubripirellula lacrimiformis]|uniref:Pentaxin family protein n=1 Tax=Rubripirellula lacrimiformis TaxID=1930273 RepID=A0A517NBC6_9BACT|nr:tandem-95 repeat protein [Rubripirellula lacrimiformis]QDT04437.1 Pentaxin family protein [Rubripirellula lacrimiformis]